MTDLMNTSKKVLILFKGSQNTIFLEEAIKVVLADTSQASELCRQSEWRLQKKQKQ